MLEANCWSCHVQIDNDLWLVVPSMPKNAPNLIIFHKGAYLNWVNWMLESFEFQMFTHDMNHWAEPAGVNSLDLKLENLQAKSLWSSAASSVSVWSNFICPLWRMSQLGKSHNRSCQIASRQQDWQTQLTHSLNLKWWAETKRWSVILMASIVSSSSYMAEFFFVQSHVEKRWSTYCEQFNCGRIWALVILSVLRTNDLTWLAFFWYKCKYIASIESIEFRLVTRSVAVMSLSLYSSMWGLNQVSSLQMSLKGSVLSSLNSFQHDMLKLLTVVASPVQLESWLISFGSSCSGIDVSYMRSSSSTIETMQGRGTQALKLDNLARHLV